VYLAKLAKVYITDPLRVAILSAALVIVVFIQ
jgi:hypothetical protein